MNNQHKVSVACTLTSMAFIAKDVAPFKGRRIKLVKADTFNDQLRFIWRLGESDGLKLCEYKNGMIRATFSKRCVQGVEHIPLFGSTRAVGVEIEGDLVTVIMPKQLATPRTRVVSPAQLAEQVATNVRLPDLGTLIRAINQHKDNLGHSLRLNINSKGKLQALVEYN